MKYYRLQDDIHFPGRWRLNGINFRSDGEVWQYVRAGFLKKARKDLVIGIEEEGVQVDLTMAEFEVLVANQKVANLFMEEQVQKLPIEVKGMCDAPYYVLVIRNEIDGVDRAASDFELWEDGNDIRPDLAGTYKWFFQLKIDSTLTGGLDIFRIKNFNTAVIVSDRLKMAFENAGIVGATFKEV